MTSGHSKKSVTGAFGPGGIHCHCCGGSAKGASKAQRAVKRRAVRAVRRSAKRRDLRERTNEI
jgi:hypothetical protein